MSLTEFDIKKQREYLDKLLLSNKADYLLEKLNEKGDLVILFPEVQAIVGFGGNGHKDLWAHTKQVVKQSLKYPTLRWAALFHDIGKPKAFVKEGSKISFHNHEVKSARLFDKIAARTKLFQQKELKQIRFLILNLGRIEGYESEWTDSAVRRFARDMGEHLEYMLALSRADITTARPEKKAKILSKIDELGNRIAKLAELDARVPLLPKGLGNALMSSFAIPQGKQIAIIKEKLETLVKSQVLERQGSIEYYIEYIDEHRKNFNIDSNITRRNLEIYLKA